MEITRDHIVTAVYSAVSGLGSQKALCIEVGISDTALSLFLTGDRNPPYALLAYLGYGQKTVYYKLKED
jgi:hypothetical protein